MSDWILHGCETHRLTRWKHYQPALLQILYYHSVRNCAVTSLLCQVTWSLGTTRWRCQSSTGTSSRRPSTDASLAIWSTVVTTTYKDRMTASGKAVFSVCVCLCAELIFYSVNHKKHFSEPLITVITNAANVVYLSSHKSSHSFRACGVTTLILQHST